MSSPQREVLVTGGSGFVGRAVIDALLEAGHRVQATSRRPGHRLVQADGLNWIRWDATREPLPAVRWQGLDAVVHLAVPDKPFHFPEKTPALYEVVVGASFRLLDACRRAGVPRVLLASTGDVLGHRGGPAREDDVDYRPETFYGTAKAAAEILFRGYANLVSTAVLRFYHAYGPGGNRFLVNRMVRNVVHGREIVIEGADGVLLNPVWISDLADGVRAAVDSAVTGVLHFGGPDLLTLRELVEMAGQLCGREPRIRHLPADGSQQHAGSYERTHQLLGYTPRVSIERGIARLLEVTSCEAC